MINIENDFEKSFNDIKNKLILIYDNNEDNININYYENKIKSLITNFNKVHNSPIKFEWSQKTALLISYADNIYLDEQKNTIKVLEKFHNIFLKDVFNCVHILPFFPSSGDGGFSVKDHNKVEKRYGKWKDIKSFSKSANIMADIVINHASSQGKWFQNYLKNKNPGINYFFTIDEEFDISKVVRTRDHNLIQNIKINNENKKLWCTFSEDQIDLNFQNPDVLITFIEIIIYFISKGILIIRLDAVGFLWKESKTECLNLPKTHYIIKLLRLVINCLNIRPVIVTETNLPRKENLSYFGTNDEAHWIYNFSLAPLIVYTLLFENSDVLSNWSKGMPPAKNGSAYLNFIATHDGIGMRPVEGILNDKQLNKLFKRIEKNGGKFSHRKFMKIDKKVYEANISLFDAFKYSDLDLSGKYRLDRFIAAHCIMFALEGVPAVYLNSIFGTENNNEIFNITNHKRDLNRYKWEFNHLKRLLNNKNSKEAIIYKYITKILIIRKEQSAFHPNAIQFTLNLGKNFFGLWRQSIDKSQSIFAITNVTSNYLKFDLANINLIQDENWIDLLDLDKEITIFKVLELKPFQTMWLTNKNKFL